MGVKGFTSRWLVDFIHGFASGCGMDGGGFMLSCSMGKRFWEEMGRG